MQNKKLLIIVSVVVFLALVIIVLILTSGRRKQISPSTQTTTIVSQNVAQPAPVVKEKIYFPALSGGNLIYLAGQTQELRQVSLADKKEKIFPVNIPLVKAILWSPQKTKAILKTEGQFYFYSFSEQKLSPLKTALAQTAQWGDENTIYYCRGEEIKSFFYQFDFIKNNEQKISELPERCDKIVVYQPSRQILVYETITSDINADLNLFNLKTKQKTILISNDYLDAAPSPDNSWLIIRLNQEEKNLVAFNLINNTKKELSLSGDLNKMAWLDNENLIIAAYENDGEYIYSFNISTKQKRILSKNKENITALNLMVSPDKKKLYFTAENVLYKLEIK